MHKWSGMLPASDGKQIFVQSWQPDTEARGVLQLVHGMAEHSGVYDDFIGALNANGIAVYSHDHRGHGQTIANEAERGHYEPSGWQQVINDVGTVRALIEAEQDCPIFLLGHSMGSFLARRVAQLQGNRYAGLLISGTGATPGFMGYLGRGVASLEIAIRGPKAKSKLMDKLLFGAFNAKFKPNRTSADWISSDNAQVDKYLRDPNCGFICTTSFYRELIRGVMEVNQEKETAKTPKWLPIYIFSGDRDPVGDMGKGVRKVYDLYQSCGCLDVTLQLYPNGRHEMLHEVNREEVFFDVIQWLNRYI